MFFKPLKLGAAGTGLAAFLGKGRPVDDAVEPEETSSDEIGLPETADAQDDWAEMSDDVASEQDLSDDAEAEALGDDEALAFDAEADDTDEETPDTDGDPDDTGEDDSLDDFDISRLFGVGQNAPRPAPSADDLDDAALEMFGNDVVEAGDDSDMFDEARDDRDDAGHAVEDGDAGETMRPAPLASTDDPSEPRGWHVDAEGADDDIDANMSRIDAPADDDGAAEDAWVGLETADVDGIDAQADADVDSAADEDDAEDEGESVLFRSYEADMSEDAPRGVADPEVNEVPAANENAFDLTGYSATQDAEPTAEDDDSIEEPASDDHEDEDEEPEPHAPGTNGHAFDLTGFAATRASEDASEAPYTAGFSEDSRPFAEAAMTETETETESVFPTDDAGEDPTDATDADTAAHEDAPFVTIADLARGSDGTPFTCQVMGEEAGIVTLRLA